MSGPVLKAVVFDLFDTLIDYDEARSREFTAAAATMLGLDEEEFHSVWRAGRPVRETGPLAAYVDTLSLADTAAVRLISLRYESARALLRQPRDGAVETLQALRERGLKTGLITVCSEDTADVWPETPFAALFDAEVFSCSVGVRKPDPRIYLAACELLGIEPHEAVFVGDGANDELAGAERVGMRAVLIGDALDDWSGERIATVPEILELV